MEVLDDKNRVILSVGNDGQFAIARFKDMPERDKDFLIKVYSDLASCEPEKVRKFLDFEDDEGVFCS